SPTREATLYLCADPAAIIGVMPFALSAACNCALASSFLGNRLAIDNAVQWNHVSFTLLITDGETCPALRAGRYAHIHLSFARPESTPMWQPRSARLQITTGRACVQQKARRSQRAVPLKVSPQPLSRSTLHIARYP